MSWVSDVVSLIVLGIMGFLSWCTGHNLPGVTVWPMQWGLDGKPTWHAPRSVALAFVPVLAALVLLGVSVARHGAVKPGIAGMQILIAVTFLVADLLYLYFAYRTLADGSSRMS